MVISPAGNLLSQTQLGLVLIIHSLSFTLVLTEIFLNHQEKELLTGFSEIREWNVCNRCCSLVPMIGQSNETISTVVIILGPFQFLNFL